MLFENEDKCGVTEQKNKVINLLWVQQLERLHRKAIQHPKSRLKKLDYLKYHMRTVSWNGLENTSVITSVTRSSTLNAARV